MAKQKVVGLTANPPAPDDWVEIEHDGIDGTTRVHPRTLPHWEARHWRVVEHAAEAPTTAEQVAVTDPPTDPAPTTRKPARTAASGTEA